MKKVRNGRLLAWVVVAILGASAGFYVASVKLYKAGGPNVGPYADNPVSQANLAETDPAVAAAMKYARALQEGFCEEIIRNTAWMVDRMHRVAIESSGQEAIDKAWDNLCAKVADRSIEGNLLLPEGIEDQYVFAPGVTLDLVGVDSGRDNLDRPIEERVWIRVTFPRRQTAPLARSGDEGQMLAIRAMTVGINVGKNERLVVKAGVIGNLDIDVESLSFDWPA